MIFLRHILIILISTLLFSCSSKAGIEDQEEPEVNNCSNTNIGITEQDNVVIQHTTNPVFCFFSYNETVVKIKYTQPVGNDGETETFTFIFNKLDGCLKIKRAFKFYDGKQVDVSAITEINVSEFYTGEWILDKKFTGNIIFTDPHDKKVYSRKFWLEFTAQNLEIENTNYIFFNDCFGGKLPIEIDMNNDGIVDFKIISEKIRDIGNKPQFNQYTIKLISTNNYENQILSPKKNQEPYTVIFEPPFTSENTNQYFNGVKVALDVFYEFDEPYQNFNFFLHNNLTYKKYFDNSLDNYYVVKMGLDNKEYYGWIKFKFNSPECSVEILDTYLHPIEAVHISVQN